MKVADAVAERSDCTRRQCGAVIVDANNRIIATGYNGPPSGLTRSCSTGGCPRAFGEAPPNDYSRCISIHAEANALLFCDRSVREGGTIYVTSSICINCAKEIANSGLARVVMRIGDDDVATRLPLVSVEFLEESGLTVLVYG